MSFNSKLHPRTKDGKFTNSSLGGHSLPAGKRKGGKLSTQQKAGIISNVAYRKLHRKEITPAEFGRRQEVAIQVERSGKFGGPFATPRRRAKTGKVGANVRIKG